MSTRTWTEKDIDLVHAYIEGELDREQGVLVEQRLDTDAAFRRLLQTVIATRAHRSFDAIAVPSDERFEAMERTLMQSLTVPETPVSGWRRILALVPVPSFTDAVAMAAIVAVILGTLVMVWPETPPDTEPKKELAGNVTPKKAVKKHLRKQVTWQELVTSRLGGKIGGAIGKPVMIKATGVEADALNALLGKPHSKEAILKSRPKAVDINPNSMFLTSTNEAAAYRLDPGHTIALQPSSRVQITGYSSGLCMINIHSGGIIAIDRDTPRSMQFSTTQAEDVDAFSVKALVVRADTLLVTPAGTVFTVEQTLDNYINVQVAEGSVSMFDTRYSHRSTSVAKGSMAKYYRPQGSVSISEFTGDPIDSFLKNITAIRNAVQDKQSRGQEPANQSVQPQGHKHAPPEVQPTTGADPAVRPHNPAVPKEPKGQSSMVDMAQKRFFDKVRLLMSKNQWTSASQTLEDFLGETSTETAEQEAIYLLGVCYERQGKWEDAKRQFERYTVLYPGGEHIKDIRGRLNAIIKRLKR